MAVKTIDTPTVNASIAYTTNTVTSKDGTVISYRQLGHGPGMIMLHGSMESAASHMQLARELADSFTVYLPDRRGHHIPSPDPKTYNMQKEVEDLDALLMKTGTHNVFGVSAGGIICLQAALTLPTIRKAAVYEPALIVNNSISTDFLPRYEREIAEGKTAAALITGMLGGQMGAAFMQKMPRWFLEFVSNMSMRSEDKKAKPGDVTMRMLAPTLHYDFSLVIEMAEKLTTFKAMSADVLLLGGSESPVWLKLALNALEKVLPHMKRVEFPGLNHGSSSDLSSTNRESHPEIVAAEMRRFFA
jgi:pimeloyl-ACP methyl ester carboxylesterase